MAVVRDVLAKSKKFLEFLPGKGFKHRVAFGCSFATSTPNRDSLSFPVAVDQVLGEIALGKQP
jgi:hypothetical protein